MDPTDIANKIFEANRDIAQSDNFTIEQIYPLLVKLMEEVEKYTYLTGDQKKTVVLLVISRIIDILPVDDNVKSLLRNIPMGTVIDLIVSAARSEFALQTKKKLFSKLPCCK